MRWYQFSALGHAAITWQAAKPTMITTLLGLPRASGGHAAKTLGLNQYDIDTTGSINEATYSSSILGCKNGDCARSPAVGGTGIERSVTGNAARCSPLLCIILRVGWNPHRLRYGEAGRGRLPYRQSANSDLLSVGPCSD